MLCPNCGHEQDGGSECLGCGVIFVKFRSLAGQGLSDLEDLSWIRRQIRTGYRVFRWLSLVLLLASVGLIIRTEPAPATATEPHAIAKLHRKLRVLHRQLRAGARHVLHVNEAELNSWLKQNIASLHTDATAQSLLDADAGLTGGAERTRATIKDLKISLSDELLRAYVLFDVFGKKLSLILTGRLKVDQGYLRLLPVSGKLGSLPIPKVALDEAVAQIFDSPSNKQKFLLPPQVRDIKVRRGELIVQFDDFISAIE